MRKLHRTVDAARKAMAIGSLESDRDRDVADWEAMRRVVTIYMPLLAAVPVVATMIFYFNG